MQNELKTIREEKNLSVMEFAVYLEVHYNTYRGWEIGTSQPPLEIALDLAKKLNKKVEDIWHK